MFALTVTYNGPEHEMHREIKRLERAGWVIVKIAGRLITIR